MREVVRPEFRRWAVVIVATTLACGGLGWWWLSRVFDDPWQGAGNRPMDHDYARQLLPKEIIDFRLVFGWYFHGGSLTGSNQRNIHALIKASDVPALDAALTKDEQPRQIFDDPAEIDAYFDLETKAKPTIPAGSVAWGKLGGYMRNYSVLCPPKPPQPGDDGFTVDFYYVGEVH